MDELLIQRTSYEAVVRLDPDKKCWVWIVPPQAPEAAVEQRLDEEHGVIYFRLPDQADLFAISGVRRDLTPGMLLAMLTPEESRRLMGYCQHLTDQLHAQVLELIDVLRAHVEGKRWAHVHEAHRELGECLGAQEVAGLTAAQAYEALDSNTASDFA